MNTTNTLFMSGALMILFWGIAIFIAYIVIKSAVKNAIHEKLGDRAFIDHLVKMTQKSIEETTKNKGE